MKESTYKDNRKKLIKASRLHSIHWIIIGLSLVLTFSAWYYSKLQLEQKLELKFNRNAEQVVSLVKERMELYENALWGGVAYADANKEAISYLDWLSYANSLKIDQAYPGINGIGIIYNIQQDQLDDYLQVQRSLRPDYDIHPIHKETEYWPITYVEPAKPNAKAIGLDMAFEHNRYSSIKKARDTGTAQLTGPITLVQDSKKTPGFLFYTPFYKYGVTPKTVDERREYIVGVTYAPFIMKNLMQGTLAEKNRQVSIEIHDGDEVLFNDHEGGEDNQYDVNPLFSKMMDLDFYGRTWTFTLTSNLGFREEAASDQPYFILIAGLTIDSLLLGLFIFLSRANRQALFYADEMTNELTEKTLNLEKSNKDLEQFSYVASHDLKSPLNAMKQLSEWIVEDCEDILPDNSKKHLTLLSQRSERMMTLLNDLLDYSRSGTKKYDNETVNIQALSQDILFMLGGSTQFTCHCDDVVINIPKKPFEIVLRNLISNAIKHHDKETGNITVSYLSSGDNHKITVTDDGPGIPQEFHSKALEMFQTLQPRDRVEGSGMGLAIIKRIVENYDGYVEIQSDGTQGTSIILIWKK
ncbi:CHASE domain-containing protein [Vibrio sp.]|nr:CHASE domain-containing protein [Vibrio sp.]